MRARAMISHVLLVLVMFAMAPCLAGAATGTVPHPELVPAEDEIFGWIETIVAQGVRRSGYPADHWLSRWGKALLEGWGIETRLQEVPTTCWFTGDSSVTVAGERFGAFPFARGNWQGKVAGELFRYRSEADLDKVKGKVVVVDYELGEIRPAVGARAAVFVYDPDGDLADTSHPNPLTQHGPGANVVQQIFQHDPKAVIAVLDNYFESFQIVGRQSHGRDTTEYLIPAIWVSPGTGERIDELMADGANRAEMMLASWTDEQLTTSVVGVLPGASDEYVIIGTHKDAQFATAVEDTSGVASVLAQARYWSRVPREERPHSMVFFLSSGHLAGTAGTQHFVKDQALMDRTLLEIHVEHVGLEYDVEGGQLVSRDRPEPRSFYTPDIPWVQDEVKGAIEAEDLRRSMVGGPPPRGDSWPFHVLAGVPTIQFVSVPVYLLDAADTLDKVDRSSLVPLTRALIRVINALAGETAAGMRAAVVQEQGPGADVRRRFDADGDGELDDEERRKLREYLASRRSLGRE